MTPERSPESSEHSSFSAAEALRGLDAVTDRQTHRSPESLGDAERLQAEETRRVLQDIETKLGAGEGRETITAYNREVQEALGMEPGAQVAVARRPAKGEDHGRVEWDWKVSDLIPEERGWIIVEKNAAEGEEAGSRIQKTIPLASLQAVQPHFEMGTEVNPDILPPIEGWSPYRITPLKPNCLRLVSTYGEGTRNQRIYTREMTPAQLQQLLGAYS